jgi:radical SAM superfamily enzyme YgiQ (UPF0313 family)
MSTALSSSTRTKFFVEIVKPSHYDDDGYVIQWVRAFIPSNSLACIHSLVEEARASEALGPDVDIVMNTYDECHTVIPFEKIRKRMLQPGHRGILLLVGVQSNQFPRAVDIARSFRDSGIPVVIGGFHVSGCLAMLKDLPPDILEARDLGISLFAGEGELGRVDEILRDAYNNTLQSIYNYMDDLPSLEGVTRPYLPPDVCRRSFKVTAFDVGRGCPFRCSFCTIINVQGRKSRYRTADDVEAIVRAYILNGVNRFFITDDNMARNKNWESIFDRLIELKERHGLKFKFMLQVDTMCHRIPGFIEKAVRAGCHRVFIGMESINADNLVAAKKFQNKFSEYRAMLHAWRSRHVLTIAGYILGFPADTPETIRRDIATIQREVPVDILEFFILTPLPGSADHKALYEAGVWMNPDMNMYDVEHVTTAHPKMSTEEWRNIYHEAWNLYYSPEHITTLLKRAKVMGAGLQRTLDQIMIYYGSYRFERVHPLQAGFVRRKVRTTRRSGMPIEPIVPFYARRLFDVLSSAIQAVVFYLWMQRVKRKVLQEIATNGYMDLALSPVNPADLIEDKPTAPAPVAVPLKLDPAAASTGPASLPVISAGASEGCGSGDCGSDSCDTHDHDQHRDHDHDHDHDQDQPRRAA